MPQPGLSLVGFMDQTQAVNHFLTSCIPADPAIPALVAEWNAARAKLGAPVANAGAPDIRPIPAADQPYIAHLLQQPWAAGALAGMPGAQFMLVEIEPLLAYQFTVDNGRSDHHCGAVPQPPSIADMLPICLPHTFPAEQINVQQQQNSVLLKAHSLNVRMTAQGFFQAQNTIGIQFGISLPLVHVVRFNSRYYLHNGFHRTVGMRLKGATHVPCLVRDVAAAQEAGIRADGATFAQQLLESADAPTVGHFTRGCAYDVTLKRTTRILHVSWAEYGMPDE